MQERDDQMSLNEIALELNILFDSMVESLDTPFDTICKLCLFEN